MSVQTLIEEPSPTLTQSYLNKVERESMTKNLNQDFDKEVNQDFNQNFGISTLNANNSKLQNNLREWKDLK